MDGRPPRAGALLPALVALSLLLACSEGFPPEFPVPEFSLKSPGSGRVLTHADVVGRPTVLYWFTSW